MMSCNYKLLHEAEIGSVEVCTDCANFRLNIGTLLALISPDSFNNILNDFIARRNHYFEQIGKEEMPEQILICLNKNNLFLKLSPHEFNDLIDLFEMSLHMMHVNKIMQLSE